MDVGFHHSKRLPEKTRQTLADELHRYLALAADLNVLVLTSKCQKSIRRVPRDHINNSFLLPGVGSPIFVLDVC